LDQVKTTFADKPETYNEFLDVMREFKTGNLNTEQVVSRVSLLFSQHQNLMEGFHNFLPQGGRTQANGVHQHLNGISSPNLMNGTTIGSGVLNAGANGSKGAVEFNHAINYVNKIKTRYAHDARTYKEFLEILQTYQKDSKPIQEV
ncbi:hypothetical protein BT69DRAFT_1189090, partial [Atractiella rhizophila]